MKLAFPWRKVQASTPETNMNAQYVASYFESFPTTQPLIADLEKQMEDWVARADGTQTGVEIRISAVALDKLNDREGMIKRARTRLENWFKANQWANVTSQVCGEGASLTIAVSAELPPAPPVA